MPRPQLELRWDRLDRPLFGPLAGAPTGLAIEPLSANELLVKGGAEMLGVEGTYWALHAAGRPMSPRHALATGRITETRGADAVLRIVSRIKRIEQIPADALAVPLSSAGPERVPVRLGGMTDEQRGKLAGFLDRRLGALVEVVGDDSFARFVVNRGTADGSRWDIADHTGTGVVESVEGADIDVVTRGLEEFLVRSRNASELLALENLFSDLRLEADVFRPQELETRPLGETGIQVIADTATPRYRVRRDDEPHTLENSLQIAIRVEQPSYLTVVDVDAEGNVNVLFPNAFQDPSFYPDGFVSAGESVVIPDSLDDANLAGFHLDYAPPAGLDTVRVFAAADLETARRIREFAQQIRSELDSIETIASLQLEDEEVVFTRAVEPPISFQEARQSLLRPRGIIVVPLTDDAPEVIDPTLSVPPEFLGAAGDVSGSSSDPGFEAPLDPPFEPDSFAPAGFSDPLAGAPAVPGDWTAVSIPILVEEE